MSLSWTIGAAKPEWFGSAWRYPLLLAIVWLLYAVAITVYRLTWHPLAKFPGPVLARSSYMYEFWFDVILEGRYTRRISTLHQKYGPIVRINPDELHCNDPRFVDVVYAHGKEKRNKSTHYLAAMPWGLRQATVCTADHDHHKLRRAPIVKFFSRSYIMQRERIIHDKIQQLCEKLLGYRECGPFPAAAAFSCFTTDALTSFCFGESLGNLDTPGWNPSFKGTIDKITGLFYFSRHLHALARLADTIPLSLCRHISPEIGLLLELIRFTIPQLVERARTNSKTKYGETPTIIETLLESDLPEVEKTTERLTSEAIAVILGGTHSISTVLSIASYYLLTNPTQLKRLATELRTVVSDETDIPGWATLEKLPYLNGVVQESLRLMHGVASRISVVSPDDALVYGAAEKSPDAGVTGVDGCYTIPAGYAIGMSAYLIHTNPDIFPEASQFIPDRWIDEQGKRNRGLEKYLFAFSQGHRQCIGIQLAYCELYIAVAALALRVWPHMRLHDTTISDVEYDHDQMIAMVKKGSKGVHVAMH